jgi:hypothetical protein
MAVLLHCQSILTIFFVWFIITMKKKLGQTKCFVEGKRFIIIIAFAIEHFFLIQTQTAICLFTMVVSGIALFSGTGMAVLLHCHVIALGRSQGS